MSNPPKPGSAQWKRNEAIINSTPALRKLREQSQGFSGNNSSATGGWTPTEAYKNNYDAIFRKKDDSND